MWTLLFACKPDPSPSTDDSSPTTDDSGTSPTDTPVPLEDDLCSRAVVGVGDDRTPIVALSEAHADVRLFGIAGSFPAADEAIVAALAGDDPIGAPDIDAYVAAAEDVCHLPAETGTLPAASVEERDGWIVVHPGTGTLDVPDLGLPVALDLRGLPDAEGLDEALRTALSETLPHDLVLPTRKVRTWNGHVDQWYSAGNVYSVEGEELPGETVPASGSSNPVLVVLTEARMAPAAAEVAGAVALDGQSGFLVGRSVVAAVAEAYWSPVADGGLLWRGELLKTAAGENWPDVIPPQVETDDPDAALADLDVTTWEVPAAGGEERAGMRLRNPFNETPDGTWSVATLRASLVIAHGTLRRFFPYFDVVGDGIDDRLEEVLAGAIDDPTDQYAHRKRLGRMAEAIHDGHAFFGSLEGYIELFLPVTLDHVDGRPVIVHSGDAGLLPGDTIVAIGGEPIEDVYADWRSWHSGATEGYALDLAGREMWYMWGPETYTVEDPDGVRRDVTVEPVDYETFLAVPYTWNLRANGLLDDLGHPELAYLNMSGEVTTSVDQVEELLALGAEGLVLDMRGYPGVNHYAVAELLNTGDYLSPVFNVPVWRGPGRMEVDSSQYSQSASDSAFTGPIVLLVGPVTVSAAENFSQMLVGAHRVTVVGRRSAGTNGNITGMTLPGGFVLSFTGMQLLNPDGSQFHAIGIVPDVEVPADAVRYRDGTDPDLDAAIEVLGG